MRRFGCLGWIGVVIGVVLLFSILSIISPVVLAISAYLIYYYDKKSPNESKKRYSIIGAIIGGIGTLFLIISLATSDSTQNTTTIESSSSSVKEISSESSISSEESKENSNESEESSKESESESSEEVAYDDPLEQSAHDVFGEDLRSFNVIEDSGMKDIYVEVNIPMNLTANMMKGSFEMDVLDYAEKVKDEEFSNIIYMAYAEATDSYGNDTEAAAGTITLSKETIGKINFEQFSRDNLPKIADNYNMNIGD